MTNVNKENKRLKKASEVNENISSNAIHFQYFLSMKLLLIIELLKILMQGITLHFFMQIKMYCMHHIRNWYVGQWYCQTSNIRCTLVGNWIVDHSDVVGASPVGAAPTTFSFSTKHLASMMRLKPLQDEKHWSFGFGAPCIRDLTVSDFTLQNTGR